MSQSPCLPVDKLNAYNLQLKTKNLHLVERYVLLTIILFILLFFLSGLKKRFPKLWLKLVSWVCYILVPILISYTMGIMQQPKNSLGGGKMFYQLYSIWTIFLLFIYAGFDNLSAFNLEERNGRSKLLFQFLIQSALLLLLIYNFTYFKTQILPILLVFLVVCLKVVERIVALAHAAGATSGIKENLKKMIDHLNEDEGEEAEVDPVSMQGFKYLVGPRYSTVKNNVIVDGVTVEKIWRSDGKLLSSEAVEGGELKDTCLSFALFWLLLGKFWGYPLYQGNSRMKAWKLVSDGLLAGRGEHERAFRVIEVELSFLRDYFYSKYIFFYLNGFYWKLCILAFPIMFWWFTFKAIDYEGFNSFYLELDGFDPKINLKVTASVTLVIFALEAMQLSVFIASRWFKVMLLSYNTKREMCKKKASLLDCCFEKVIGAICLISLCPTKPLKPWKREMDQYSLLESCTCFGIENQSLQSLGLVLGIPFPKPGRSRRASVELSEHVKKSVALSLQTYGPKLSNGIASLRGNGVEEELSWACKLKNNAEIILVWHIATGICEMKTASKKLVEEYFMVAASLSKYCAYLLAFSPSFLPVSLLEAEAMCDITIKEARELFKQSSFLPCGKLEEVNKYEKLMGLFSGKEEEGQRITTLQKGVKLGKDLLTVVKDESSRWKLLAEFWAELILFLAPSNHNEMVHAEKLAEGGEFITHLWALLIHCGIVDREN